MTEVERILKKGVIPESFLAPEIRNEFNVDLKRKKLWLVILDLFFEFKSICEKYGLTYFPIGGFLLGAVRHNGYIPWDDDLDVCMPRKDYDIFIKMSKEFSAPYFLQLPETDKGYFYGMAKIRNSNTTALNKMFQYQGFNHGIWLSVFPLDNWKDVGGEDRYMEIKQNLMDCSTYMRKTNPFLKEKDLVRVKEFGDKDPQKCYDRVNEISSQFNNEVTEKCFLPCTVYRYEKNVFYNKDFSSTILCKFEGFDINIPIGYDRILKTVYGDYMKFPPKEERGLWHSGTIFDPDKPYSYYLTDERIETI